MIAATVRELGEAIDQEPERVSNCLETLRRARHNNGALIEKLRILDAAIGGPRSKVKGLPGHHE
jgi:hypothetical protein